MNSWTAACGDAVSRLEFIAESKESTRGIDDPSAAAAVSLFVAAVVVVVCLCLCLFEIDGSIEIQRSGTLCQPQVRSHPAATAGGGQLPRGSFYWARGARERRKQKEIASK